MLDVLVVGGGINGVAIARDAAGRGLKVALCEQNDLAAHTSSASSKLVHGGLRYLEQGALGLVRRSLHERALLLRSAPHLVSPLPFVLPHAPGMRAAWKVRSGLLLYDLLDHTPPRLPHARSVPADAQALRAPLRNAQARAWCYSDARVDDARLVVLLAMDAAERGASIWPRTRCVAATRSDALWQVALADSAGRPWQVQARRLVNATGPWASGFAGQAAGVGCPPLRLVQGSHIVVPALYRQQHAYVLQQPDGRIVFVIPFEDDFSLIGTTDIPFSGNPAQACIDDRQCDYLCAAVNRHFLTSLFRSDIVHSFSGVRALPDLSAHSASQASREHVLHLDEDGAPVLHVLGGKLTSHRHLAEQAMNLMLGAQVLQHRPWTGCSPRLPGSEGGDAAAVQAWLLAGWPWLPASLARRWAGSYGRRSERIIAGAIGMDGLGTHFGADLYEAEVRYLCDQEWVHEVDDLLWRRGKLGLRLDAAQQRQLACWIAHHRTFTATLKEGSCA